MEIKCLILQGDTLSPPPAKDLYDAHLVIEINAASGIITAVKNLLSQDKILGITNKVFTLRITPPSDALLLPEASLGNPCPGPKCGGKGRIHDDETLCLTCVSR